MKQAFLAAYEESESEDEEGKENETIIMYAVIESQESNKLEYLVQLGMHIGRPPLFDGYHWDEWKMRMEVFN